MKGGRGIDILLMWIITSIAALVIDILTSSFFFAGFTVGGIAAIITQMQGSSFLTQVIIFSIVSIVAIVVEYVWFRAKIKKSIPVTLRMEEEYIGKIIEAEEDIQDKGKLKVGGIYWTVENTGEKILKGEKVKITGLKGNKLIVKK